MKTFATGAGCIDGRAPGREHRDPLDGAGE